MSFDALKKALSSDPVLQVPDYTKEFVLHSKRLACRNRGRPEPDQREGRRPSHGLLLQEAEDARERNYAAVKKNVWQMWTGSTSLPDGRPLPGGHRPQLPAIPGQNERCRRTPHQIVPLTATVLVHSQTPTGNDQRQCGRAVSPGMDRGGRHRPCCQRGWGEVSGILPTTKQT